MSNTILQELQNCIKTDVWRNQNTKLNDYLTLEDQGYTTVQMGECWKHKDGKYPEKMKDVCCSILYEILPIGQERTRHCLQHVRGFIRRNRIRLSHPALSRCNRVERALRESLDTY